MDIASDNEPPDDAEAYELWCVQLGLQPYDAAAPVAEPVDEP